ncbi:PAS domain-containing sensor histidine kinase [Candidatus Desulfarcum epimagneticum]|uniref:histidine kinase n=1 Tax=uncultured Desulfobacteraceae bacterium TaxID=218296 RepID=A0A484HP89_9BACT|nr:PAS domain-containing sensor histidine kinase [uncultured Desulfobacteraceae bacterium]
MTKPIPDGSRALMGAGKPCEDVPDGKDWGHMIFESLSFPTVILNPGFKIVAANAKFFKQFGREKGIEGQTCFECFSNDSPFCAGDDCPLSDIFTSGKETSILVRVSGRDGDVWEERVFSPIFNERGEVSYVRESFRDATDIHSLRERFQEMRSLMSKVIQSSSAGIVVGDIRGNILLMNKAAETLFGFSLKECSEKCTVRDFYPPGVAEKIMKMLRSDDYGGKGKLLNTEIEIVNSKGETIPGEIAASILYEGEKEIGSMGIYTDCRDKIEMERQLRITRRNLAQSEKLASIGRLAAGVAHEINNPLTSILFYAGMAMENEDVPDDEKENLRRVIEDVDRCKKIVKDLLVYSRQTRISRELIRVNDLVEQSLYLIRDIHFMQNIRVKKNMWPAPMLVSVDQNQMSQVMINLVINAMDAMEGVGTLELSTFPDREEKRVFIEVSDTGPGIPEDDIHKIFEPFFTTKEMGKGSGLGLSVVYGIIEKNEGGISVKHTGPGGTTFLIELPLRSPGDEGAPGL